MNRRNSTALVLLVWIAGSTYSQQIASVTPQMLPPEGADIRRMYSDYVTAPLFDLAQLPDTIRRSRESDVDFLVSTQSSTDYRYLVFAPELNGEFPVYSAGSYVLRRRKSDGGIDQLKIFLRSDPRFFIRIWPRDENSSIMSVYLAGTELHREIGIPLTIEVIMQESLERLLQTTASRVAWNLFFPEVSARDYRAVVGMANLARSMLHTLPDAEDGAMDEDGNLVFIESLVLQDQQPGFNCSGFAKWIVDGLHMGLYGSYLAVEPLKEKHLDLRGHRWSEPLEDERDPYFGLDWTRNLATSMLSAERGDVDVHPEEADVRAVRYSTYLEDVGYPVERLSLIMYLLATDEPGYFYIASLNREFGEDPQLHQHVHVAVLFPYFTSSGDFEVTVLERNVQTSIASLDDRYHDDSIHLVRVRADESYSPPIIRN